MLEWLDLLDKEIILYIYNNLKNPIIDKILFFITTLGNYGIIWMLLIIILLLVKKYRYTGIVVTISLSLSTFIGNVLLKNTIQRPRPFEALLLDIVIPNTDSFSMPSGHTVSSFAVAFTMMYLVKESWLKYCVLIFAAIMALSRIYLCVHYPTDVIAGIVLAFIVSKGVLRTKERIIDHKFKKQVNE